MIFDWISIKFCIFANAYLVLENVGNFQIGYKDSIVVLTL